MRLREELEPPKDLSAGNRQMGEPRKVQRGGTVYVQKARAVEARRVDAGGSDRRRRVRPRDPYGSQVFMNER